MVEITTIWAKGNILTNLEYFFLPHFQLKLSSSKTQNQKLFSFLMKKNFSLKNWKLLSGTLKYIVV